MCYCSLPLAPREDMCCRYLLIGLSVYFFDEKKSWLLQLLDIGPIALFLMSQPAQKANVIGRGMALTPTDEQKIEDAHLKPVKGD